MLRGVLRRAVTHLPKVCRRLLRATQTGTHRPGLEGIHGHRGVLHDGKRVLPSGRVPLVVHYAELLQQEEKSKEELMGLFDKLGYKIY